MEIKRGPLTTSSHEGVVDHRECIYLETGGMKIAVSQSSNHRDRIAIKIISSTVKMPWISLKREGSLALMKIIAAGLQEVVEE